MSSLLTAFTMVSFAATSFSQEGPRNPIEINIGKDDEDSDISKKIKSNLIINAGFMQDLEDFRSAESKIRFKFVTVDLDGVNISVPIKMIKTNITH